MSEVTYYVALPFVPSDDGIAPGEAIECFNPNAAMMTGGNRSLQNGFRARVPHLTGLNHPSPHGDHDLVLVGHHMGPADRPAIEVNRPNPKWGPWSSHGWNEQRHAAGGRESG
jgi:hypothetical protein